jgi:hypothetical protein
VGSEQEKQGTKNRKDPEMSIFDWVAEIWVLCFAMVILYFAIEKFKSWSGNMQKKSRPRMTALPIVIVCLMLAWASVALAAGPYLVCAPITYTPPAGDTVTYNVSGLPASIVATNIPPDSTGTYAFALSLAGIAAGSYTVTAQTCLNDATWGQECSAQSSPFSFTVPGSPSSPGTLKISTTQ